MNQKRPRRPFSLILLVLLVLLFTVINLARAIQTVQIWQALQRLVMIPPAYLLLSGVIWTMVGLALTIGLWRGWRNAWLVTLPVFALYTLYAWIDRLVLPGYPGRNQNWPFMLAINLLILAWTAWVVTRRNVKLFFGAMHEQPTPKQSLGPEPLSGEAGLSAKSGTADERKPTGPEHVEPHQLDG